MFFKLFSLILNVKSLKALEVFGEGAGVGKVMLLLAKEEALTAP